MRTTITLDDRLLAQVKKRAAESGTSVSRLVEQAIRLLIRTPPPAKRRDRFELVTFGLCRGIHGPLVADAYLAALAIEHGCELIRQTVTSRGSQATLATPSGRVS